MKRIISILISAIIVSTMIFTNPVHASNDQKETGVFLSANMADLIGLAERTFYDDNAPDLNSMKVSEIFTEQSDISIEETYMVFFIDIIGKLKDGSFANVSSSVQCEMNHEGIVEYSKGRIKGLKQGTAELTFKYQGKECVVNVTVEKEADIDALNYAKAVKEGQKSVPSADYNTVLNRAYQMWMVQWTTTAQFRLNDGTIVSAGTTLKGVPYSQLTQCNATEFLAALSNSSTNGFYTEHPRGNYYDATYGVDCSGFVSKAWGIPRDTTAGFVSELYSSSSSKYEKVGSYSMPSSSVTTGVSASSLTTAYAQMTETCAVVYRSTNGGHAMLIISNQPSNSRCTIIEAHNNFPSIVSYTYSQLANMHYCPFTVKTSYYNSYNN